MVGRERVYARVGFSLRWKPTIQGTCSPVMDPDSAVSTAISIRCGIAGAVSVCLASENSRLLT